LFLLYLLWNNFLTENIACIYVYILCSMCDSNRIHLASILYHIIIIISISSDCGIGSIIILIVICIYIAFRYSFYLINNELCPIPPSSLQPHRAILYLLWLLNKQTHITRLNYIFYIKIDKMYNFDKTGKKMTAQTDTRRPSTGRASTLEGRRLNFRISLQQS
jgi:hypothetical protein